MRVEPRFRITPTPLPLGAGVSRLCTHLWPELPALALPLPTSFAWDPRRALPPLSIRPALPPRRPLCPPPSLSQQPAAGPGLALCRGSRPPRLPACLALCRSPPAPALACPAEGASTRARRPPPPVCGWLPLGPVEAGVPARPRAPAVRVSGLAPHRRYSPSPFSVLRPPSPPPGMLDCLCCA
ncbi:homeobox protein ESX1-like [Penaeus indicus]|uniref:homeobox protein ESX1-like n=1 Tax=Penaeus indicus TaxID=29960 RepID=UPI00300C2DE2